MAKTQKRALHNSEAKIAYVCYPGMQMQQKMEENSLRCGVSICLDANVNVNVNLIAASDSSHGSV